MNKLHSLYQEDLQNVLSSKGIEKLHGKSFLVTGATGLLGVHLIDALMLMGSFTKYGERDGEDLTGEFAVYPYVGLKYAFTPNLMVQASAKTAFGSPRKRETDTLISIL